MRAPIHQPLPMPKSPVVRGVMGAKTRGNPVDLRIADLARDQHGVVSRRNLYEIGLTRDAIRHRLAGGRLHRLYWGVYAVGHTVLTREGHWIAAVLAAGPGAVLSHRSAAALWGIRPSGAIDVTLTRPQRQL